MRASNDALGLLSSSQGVGGVGREANEVHRRPVCPLLAAELRERARTASRSGGTRSWVISCDIDEGGNVTDILIRDVPDEVLVAIDAKAKRLGLSRTVYLRRALERERFESSGPVTLDALARLASLTADLDDPGVMSDAWS